MFGSEPFRFVLERYVSDSANHQRRFPETDWPLHVIGGDMLAVKKLGPADARAICRNLIADMRPTPKRDIVG